MLWHAPVHPQWSSCERVLRSRLRPHSTRARLAGVTWVFAGQRIPACPWVRKEVPCCAPLLPSALPSDGYGVRAVEWALAGVLPGLGSGMVRGPYAGRQLGQALILPERVAPWPCPTRAPPGEVSKAHGADPPHPRASVPVNSPPSPRRRLAFAVLARPASFALPVVRCAVSALEGAPDDPPR